MKTRRYMTENPKGVYVYSGVVMASDWGKGYEATEVGSHGSTG